MKITIQISLLLLFLMVAGQNQASETTACPAALDFTKTTLNGEERVNLCEKYLGKVVLVVNTASKCGYTYQYEGLEALYKTHKDRGLVVLGFPSNDFGNQEPGKPKQIAAFCRLTYGVQFPMFEKTRVAPRNADPFYKTLATLAGEYPAWNFHKYILDREGNLVASFSSQVEPQSEEILRTLDKLL
jgi:glutathione peroxidase